MNVNLYIMTREQLERYRTNCMNLCYHYTSLANIYANEIKRCTTRLCAMGADPDKPKDGTVKE